ARRDPMWVGDEALHIAIAAGRAGTPGQPAGGEDLDGADLGEALSRLGFRVTYWVDAAAAQEDASMAGIDAAVVLDPEFDLASLPSWVTAVAWIRDSVERWIGQANLDRYDILLASSLELGERLHAATGRKSETFQPATNPGRVTAVDTALDYVVVGEFGRDAGPQLRKLGRGKVADGGIQAVLDAVAVGTPVITDRVDDARALFDQD